MTPELTAQESTTVRFRREVASRSRSSPISSVPLMRLRGWSRNSGSLRSRRPAQPALFVVQGAALRPPLPILRVSATASSGMSAFSSARADRPETPTRHRSNPAGDRALAAAPCRGPGPDEDLERLERVSLGDRLPEPRTESETDLFDALTIMFLGAARRRPRTRGCSCGGWRRHVRTACGLSRLHSYGSLLDRDAPGADV